eukprot:tig00001038_g6516.t1
MFAASFFGQALRARQQAAPLKSARRPAQRDAQPAAPLKIACEDRPRRAPRRTDAPGPRRRSAGPEESYSSSRPEFETTLRTFGGLAAFPSNSPAAPERRPRGPPRGGDRDRRGFNGPSADQEEWQPRMRPEPTGTEVGKHRSNFQLPELSEAAAAKVREAGGGEELEWQARYNKAIQTFGKRSWRASLALLDEMKRFNVPANVVTYMEAIGSLAGQGQVREAQAVLEEMRARGLEANRTIVRHLVLGHGAAGELEEAFALVEGMEARGLGAPAPSTYETLVKACCAASDPARAAALLESILKGEVGSGEDGAPLTPTPASFSALAEGYATAGDAQGARRALALATLAGVPWPQGAVRWACLAALEAEDVPLCLETFRDARRFGGDPRALRYVATELVRAVSPLGRMDAAESLVELCREAGAEPDTHLLTALVHTAVECGEMKKAVGAVEEMKGRGLQSAVAYNIIASALIQRYAAAGKINTSFQVVDEMEAAGVAPSDVTMTTLFVACVRAGATSRAAEVVARMREDKMDFRESMIEQSVPEEFVELARRQAESMGLAPPPA